MPCYHFMMVACKMSMNLCPSSWIVEVMQRLKYENMLVTQLDSGPNLSEVTIGIGIYWNGSKICILEVLELAKMAYFGRATPILLRVALCKAL
jgi:hypothetical protein